MLAPLRQYNSDMSLSPSRSPSKRPRLSLQIKPATTPQALGKSSTALKADIDLKSPTAFNTLSNAYAIAIENSSPQTPRPSDTFDPKKLNGKPTSLRLETKIITGEVEYIHPSQRTQTPGPFSITYPDTPRSAFPSSLTPITAPHTAHPESKPSAASFTFTPPQSAGSVDTSASRIFTFAANTSKSPSSPRTPRRRAPIDSAYVAPPYTHPRSLHSILRNSPLPPRSTATPQTPSRMSMRIANRAAKKVGYNDPLTQTITTNKYVKSHIELLEESPYSATDPEKESLEKVETLELALRYMGDETKDCGLTPGPFEEMRRRLAESDLETTGARKRKRKEKKRKWEWTISSVEEDGENETTPVQRTNSDPGHTPMTAVKKTPATAIWRGASVSTDATDSEMSEAEERYVPSVADPSTDSEMSEHDGSLLADTRDSIERSHTSQSL